MKNKLNSVFSAFTLSEVLLALTIIGVVAVTTISIIRSIQDYKFKVAFKNAYSILSVAYKRAALDNNGTLVGVLNGNDYTAVVAIEPYIKYTNVYGYNTKAWHLDNQWYYSDETPVKSPHPSTPSFNYTSPSGLTLINGTLVASYTNNLSGTAQIFIDTNGFAKPNTIGKDIFLLYLDATGKLKPLPGYTNGTACSGYGWNCTAYALLNY